MAKGVIPTLSLTMPVIENPSDKLIYILKYMFHSPGWVSSWYDDHLLSMRKSMAKHTENSGTLVPALQQYINEVIHKFFTDYNCEIKVIRDDPNNDANYSMDIIIKDAAGNVVVQMGSVRKDDSNLFVFEDYV